MFVALIYPIRESSPKTEEVLMKATDGFGFT